MYWNVRSKLRSFEQEIIEAIQHSSNVKVMQGIELHRLTVHQFIKDIELLSEKIERSSALG